MRKLLWLSLLVAVPLHAQKVAPVYGCSVLAVDADVVIYGISVNGTFSQKQSAPHPANETEGIKDLCRKEIARLTAKDTQPITVGAVDLSVAQAPPDVVAEVDPSLTVFQAKVRKARALIGIVPVDSSVLTALVSEIEKALEANPDWLDSI